MSLTWATTHKYGANSLAQQFPSFQISAEDARSGNVKVESRSPSGITQDMSVVESNGIYTANFTPTEVGDWLISIMYDRQHIEGSPFHVRVYDAEQVKVHGLENGAAGKLFSFTVDTLRAGEGDLTVDVTNNGRQIPVQLHPEGRGTYRVTYTPSGGGVYTIHVHFSGMEVQGSPFTVEIIDASSVVASGDGLGMVEVNQRASFVINTGDNARTGGELKVNITSPRGAPVPCDVYNQGNGSFRVEYVVSDVGEYRIEVLYHGSAIMGSPFRVHSSDWSRITVRNLRQTGLVGHMVGFDIDTSNAGSGNLEIMVNDGTIPCSVQNRGNRQFHASFMPKETIPHIIQMRFNGRNVPNSPFTVDIRSLTNVTVSGPGLQLITVNTLAYFDVRTGDRNIRDVSAVITSPSSRPVSNHVIDNNNGSFRVEFTPTEVGTFNIEVLCEGSPINGSPFSCKTFDSSAIVVGSVPSGMVGKPVEFKVDVTRAGEGQLEIMVNRGSVPNTVKMLQKGIFLVSFTPRDSQPHYVNIKFNSEQLPSCPITVPILDTSRVTVQGEGLHQVAVNRQSYFHVSTQSAGEADLAVRVTGPTNCVVPVKVTGTASNGFDVEYTPTEAGVHRIEVEYANQLISGSPFTVKAYDVGSINVEKITDGVVGRRSSFFVNTDNAGEGNMEITIEAGGRKIQNHVRQIGQGRFEVSFTPMDACEHQVSVTFNGETIPGSPFVLGITDASKVSARGDGLSLVPCHRPSLFNINAPGARMRDLDVKVTGPRNQPVKAILRDTTNIDEFSVEWTPKEIGDHRIDISYVNMTVPGSPFTARAWDASKVVVSGMKAGRVSKANSFNIDASAAGAGNLEIIVSANEINVPNFVKQEQSARFSVSFTPQVVDTHMISVKFNGDVVPGSPFFCAVADGSRATLSGEGLQMIPVHRSATFRVDINDAGDADLEVKITSPSGQAVPPLVSGDAESGFVIDYTPNEVGRYIVKVLYAEVDVGGSPAHPEIFDSSLVRIGQINDGILGQPVRFEVDTSEAGAGNLTVDIVGHTTNAQPEITPLGAAKFDVMFVPIESCVHTINITFNSFTVPGAPFKSQIFDLGNLTVDWSKVRWVPVDKPAPIELDARGVPRATLVAKVTDRNNKTTPTLVTENEGKYLVEFTPLAVGAYTIDLQYSGQTLPGCPFTSFAYDATLVKIRDLPSYGVVNQEVAFIVDTEEAGQGDVDVDVMCHTQLVRTRRQKLDAHRHRYTFVPTIVADHSIEVNFNYEVVKDSPKTLRVADPLKSISVSNNNNNHAVVDRQSVVIINTDNLVLDQGQMKAEIKAPNGELVPAKIVMQPDEDYKVEYSSKYTGRHMVEILYAGQAIMGSPFYVEIYDPNKIRIEGGRSGSVGQPIDFEIIRSEAGKAELGVTITNPTGTNITYDITPTPKGDRVTYTPSIPGPYQIYITYGGLDVPGCPITQNVTEASLATAYGDGLYKAGEHKNTSFFVDTKGQPGDLFIQIDGPNSMAKYKVDQDTSGRYLVTYVPVEVGQYDVTIKWNGYEIEGSPFHPKVMNPSRVVPIGGWEQLLSAQGKASLTANQTRRIDFDTSLAGEGQLTAEVRGPGGIVPVTVEGFGGQRSVTFTPQGEGDYYITLWWNEVQLPRCPIVATTHTGGFYNSSSTMATMQQTGGMVEQQQQYQPPVVMDTMVKQQQVQQVVTTSQVSSVNHEKVVLMGRGLTGAQVHEEAEFVIDGTDAGPGVPSVKLTGVTTDIDIQVTPVGVNKYRCTYVPIMPGAYLLSITWSDRQVRGSPFKVNICASSDASKVDCTGNGLKMGIMGREIKSTIDARQAGPGELTAHCTGPTKVAFCQLFDHHDGTFTLNIKPQEPGRHILQVKYGGEHVPGSPFELKVSGAPDASKVKVTGPGVEHGILATFRSHFICETRGAGAGQLTVRVRGPKGAFRVEMQRESQRDRTILCRYDPTEVGEYAVHVRWSDKDVPGSPFNIRIFDTKEELDRALATLRHRRPDNTNMTMASMTWHDDEM